MGLRLVVPWGRPRAPLLPCARQAESLVSELPGTPHVRHGGGKWDAALEGQDSAGCPAPPGGGTAPGSPMGPLARASQHTAALRAQSPVGVSRQNPRPGSGTRPFGGEGSAARRGLRVGSGLRLVVPWCRPCGLPANPLLGEAESRSGFQASSPEGSGMRPLLRSVAHPTGGASGSALPGIGARGATGTATFSPPPAPRFRGGSGSRTDRRSQSLLRPYRSGIRQVGPVGAPRARWTASRSTAAAVGVASPSVQAKRWVP